MQSDKKIPYRLTNEEATELDEFETGSDAGAAASQDEAESGSSQQDAAAPAPEPKPWLEDLDQIKSSILGELETRHRRVEELILSQQAPRPERDPFESYMQSVRQQQEDAQLRAQGIDPESWRAYHKLQQEVPALRAELEQIKTVQKSRGEFLQAIDRVKRKHEDLHDLVPMQPMQEVFDALAQAGQLNQNWEQQIEAVYYQQLGRKSYAERQAKPPDKPQVDDLSARRATKEELKAAGAIAPGGAAYQKPQPKIDRYDRDYKDVRRAAEEEWSQAGG